VPLFVTKWSAKLLNVTVNVPGSKLFTANVPLLLAANGLPETAVPLRVIATPCPLSGVSPIPPEVNTPFPSSSLQTKPDNETNRAKPKSMLTPASKATVTTALKAGWVVIPQLPAGGTTSAL
jgi:hypothetical protein